jgi:hypothetical protein
MAEEFGNHRPGKGIRPDEIRRIAKLDSEQRRKLKIARKKLWEDSQEWMEAKEETIRVEMSKGISRTTERDGPEHETF